MCFAVALRCRQWCLVLPTSRMFWAFGTRSVVAFAQPYPSTNAPSPRLDSPCMQLWNVVADGAPGGAVATDGDPMYTRATLWSFGAARLLLSLRQAEFPAVVIREEMVDKVHKWIHMDTLPQRCYGCGLLLGASPHTDTHIPTSMRCRATHS